MTLLTNKKNIIKTSIMILTMTVSLIFSGCGSQPKFKAYVPPKQEVKVVYEEKIIYKGGKVNSIGQTRKNFEASTQHFNFKANAKKDYNAYALVIGINEYKENTNVAYADYSALSFEKLAKTTFGVPEENIITLINSDASSGQLKSKLDIIREIPEKGGTIYLFYAGHGVPGKDGKVYMLPSDMSADAIHLEPNLQLDRIYKNLSQSLASNVFVFMDSCFSGKDDSGELLYKGVAPVLRASKVKIQSDKFTIMTAGASNDFANDLEQKEQRMFSYYLIEQLSQGNQNLNTVYETVRRKVKRASLLKGIGYKQVPQVYGSLSKSLY